MKTKIVAFDVYGTILPSIGENVKRKGIENLLNKLRNEGFLLCTCSDAEDESELLENLGEAGINLDYFDKFFKMPREGKDFIHRPKDFSRILEHYRINPDELTVIGDRYERDIKPALELGCNAIQVPEYKYASQKNYYDLNKIRGKI